MVLDTRFRAILDFHKIQLSEEEYGLLRKRFVAAAKNEINYIDFDNLLRHYSGDWEAQEIAASS